MKQYDLTWYSDGNRVISVGTYATPEAAALAALDVLGWSLVARDVAPEEDGDTDTAEPSNAPRET